MADEINNSGGDNSGVTAIKVKVAIDTTSAELRKKLDTVIDAVDDKTVNVKIKANADKAATDKAVADIDTKLKIVYDRIAEMRSLLSKESKLNLNTDSAKHELEKVREFIVDTDKEIQNLKTELGSKLPKEVYGRYSEELRKLKRLTEQLEGREKDVEYTKNKKDVKGKTDSLKENYRTAKSNYDSRKDESGKRIRDSLKNVGDKISELDKLNIGTAEYSKKLSEANECWLESKSLIDEDTRAINSLKKSLDAYKKNALRNIDGISENASDENKNLVSGANQKVLDLRSDLLQKPYANDYFSDEFQKDFAELKEAMLEADAVTKAYKESYGKLERQATSTLSKIYKAQSKLSNAGITKFDSILVGDGNGSFESQLKSLMNMDSQSEEYAATLAEIISKWESINNEIDIALDGQEKLKREEKKRTTSIEKIERKLSNLKSVANQKGHQYNINLQDYIVKDSEGDFNKINKEIDDVKKNIGSPDFQKLLDDLSNSLSNIEGKIKNYKNAYQNTAGEKQFRNNLSSLIREVENYKRSLHGLEKEPKIAHDLDELVEKMKNALSAGDFSVDAKQFREDLYEIQLKASELGLEVESTGQRISRLFKEHIQTTLATTGVALISKGLSDVYNNVVKIDSAMTELRKVTNETSAGYERFTKRAATTSRELGANISNYINAVADWSRLGYDLVDAEELARVSTLFRNVGDGISTIENASSYMVSILNGFQLAADDAQHVIDVINEVANNEPVSASGIAEILTRSSAAMYAAGNTLEETIALGTAMNSVLQNEETTGTTLKTVSMYLRAAKTEAESAGIEIDGMADSTSKLRKEMKSLTGVDIMADAAGKEFKSTYQILKEISEVWDDLTDVTKANVTNLLGGKRNANAVTSVLENFTIAENSLKDAANSANSAIKENKKYLDSIQGKLDQLSSSFQKFSQDLLDSDLVKFVVELGTAVVDLADGMVNLAGALPTIAAVASTVLSIMQMSGKLKDGAGKVNMPSYVRCT